MSVSRSSRPDGDMIRAWLNAGLLESLSAAPLVSNPPHRELMDTYSSRSEPLGQVSSLQSREDQFTDDGPFQPARAAQRRRVSVEPTSRADRGTSGPVWCRRPTIRRDDVRASLTPCPWATRTSECHNCEAQHCLNRLIDSIIGICVCVFVCTGDMQSRV